ncbi:MAG: hypothetical protein GY774_20060, partial [Planctomycetes bacterium]|nr:hypothetical protein [Planctomycetota bacterium]
TVLSDENGDYQFINLEPGKYQVRCYTLNGYTYYSEDEKVTSEASRPAFLQLDRGKTRKNLENCLLKQV